MGYTIYEYLCFFMIYSFLGWVTEIIFQTIKEGHFINRGFLRGPVCPIYGFGLLLVIHFLEPLKSNLLILFIGSVIFTTLLELATGYVLEKIFSIRWWDYSKEKFNLNGYICLGFSIIWGLACVFVINIIHPLIYTFVTFIPEKVGIIAVIVCSVIFILDTVLTVATILKFKSKLKRLSQIGDKLLEFSDGIGKHISDETLIVAGKTDRLKEDMYLEKLAFKQLSEERKDIIENYLMKFRYLSYLKTHPKIQTSKYRDLFDEIKENIKKRKQ